jgi:hypothetical protein
LRHAAWWTAMALKGQVRRVLDVFLAQSLSVSISSVSYDLS